MKIVAFAGEHAALKQFVKKYTGNSYPLDVMHHRMADDEQVKILVSKDPYGQEANRYQWTHKAEKIFVCVDANNDKFVEHFDGEIKIVNDNREKIVLIAYANGFSLNKFKRLQEYAFTNQHPLIFCFTDTNDAYYAMNANGAHQDFNEIVDNVINNKLEVENSVEEPEPERENKRRRCSVM